MDCKMERVNLKESTQCNHLFTDDEKTVLSLLVFKLNLILEVIYNTIIQLNIKILAIKMLNLLHLIPY